MPRLSIWMVRASLLHLGAGFTLCMLVLFNKGLPFDPTLWRWLPAHVDLVFFGWTLQLAMGTAFWILPRFSRTPRYGRTWLGWLSFGLLNSGVVLSVTTTWGLFNGLMIVGRLFTLAAAAAFLLLIWSRIKATTLLETHNHKEQTS